MIETIPMTGSTPLTGNNTGTAVRTDANETVAFEFEVTAIGATPTVTWIIQGSMDASNWYPVNYVTDATDTAAVAGLTSTAVGKKIIFLSNPVARRYKYYRVVTSANTNVTYSAVAHRIAKP
jgi:hypothetical protein